MRIKPHRCTPLARPVIVALKTVKIESMAKVSTLRKLGVVARVAGVQARRSRMLNAVWGGVRATGRSFGHAANQLWLEVTGTLFLTIAAFGAVALVREYLKYQAGQATASRLALVIGFTAMFAWFGMSSFSRAKRKAQRQ